MGAGIQRNYIDQQQAQLLRTNGYSVQQEGNRYYYCTESAQAAEQIQALLTNSSGNASGVRQTGTVLERTAPEHKGTVIGTPTKEYTVSVNSLIERMGLTDETLQAEFIQFMTQQENLSVDEDGNIKFDSNFKTALNDALKAFAELHKENFVDPNAQKYVTFTDTTDQEMIELLQNGDKPAIAGQAEADNSRRYAVRDLDGLNSILSTQVGETEYEAVGSRSATLDAVASTSTTTEESMVDVPDNLRESRSARRTLKSDAQTAYKDLLESAKNDPDLRGAIDIYIADSKYSKKIDKRMAELSEYTTTMGGTKKKTVKRDAADIVQLYINDRMKPEDRNKLNAVIAKIQASTNPEDQAKILKELKGANIAGVPNSFDELDDGLKRKGALLAVTKELGLDSKTLLRLMATQDVMADRSDRQIRKDDQYFAEHQAKDFVKNQQAEQDIANTTVHFSKSSRRGASDDGRIHTDIGKRGRALVKACPTMLCDEVDKAHFGSEDDGYFEATINGEKKYFKFSEDKWKTFMGICCDPSNTTEDQINVLFGNDPKAKDKFMKDLNMTLNEGRDILKMELPSPYGESGTLSFESIIGKDNEDINNRELNRLRDMVESAGYSVDVNKTPGKRMLHLLKGAGIGAATAMIPAGIGSLLAGAVNISGVTDDRMIDYNGKTDSRVIHDSTQFKYTDSNGEAFSQTVNKNITVDGQDYSGQVLAEGQDYSGNGNTYLKTMGNAAGLGAAAGLLGALSTMKNVNDKGRNTDLLFSLKKEVTHVDNNDENLSIEVPQFTTVETRQGQKEIGTEIPKLKAVAYRGPSAYSGLYQYEDGTPVNPRDFAKAYQNKINGVMTDYNFFVYPELTVPGKGKIVPVANYEDEYKKITPGQPGGQRGVVRNPPGRRTIRAEGTIR